MKRFILQLSLLILFAGCEGDPGKAGVDYIGDDVQAPTVDIILPQGGQNVYDIAVLEAWPWDDFKVTRVDFLIDGVEVPALAATAPPWQSVWNCSEAALGRHFIQAAVYDQGGRRGLSDVVLVIRADISDRPSQDTLRYFDPSIPDEIVWRLPDSLGVYSGYGVRFTTGRTATLRRLFARFHKRFDIRGADTLAWNGTELLFVVAASDDGLPGEILDTLTFVGQNMRMVAGETTVWYRLRFSSIELPPEFFVLATLAPGATGDTLGILSDDGTIKNYHGVVKVGEEWRTFTAARRTAFNPLIYAVVEY